MSDNTKEYVDKTYLGKFWDERVKKAPNNVNYKLDDEVSAATWATSKINDGFYGTTNNTLVGVINELGYITDENGITVTKDLGGIKKNKNYPVGTTLVTILTDLLCQYYEPSLRVSTTPSPNELGVATTGTATVTLTAGAKPVTSCSYSYKYTENGEEKTNSGTLDFVNNQATLSSIPLTGVAQQTYSSLFTINDGKTTKSADAVFNSEAKVIAFFSSSDTMTAAELAAKISATENVYKGFENKALSSAKGKTQFAISVPMAANSSDVYLYVATPTSNLVKVGDSMNTAKAMQAVQNLSNVACNDATSNYKVYRATDTSNDDGSHAGTFYFWMDV